VSETIAGVTIPQPSSAGVWPLKPDFGSGLKVNPPVAVHSFASGNRKVEQRFRLGNGAARYVFKRARLSYADVNALTTFWEGSRGAYDTFTYHSPQTDGTTVDVTVRIADPILSLEQLASGAVSNFGITFAEVPDPSAAPSYTATSHQTRFPDSGLQGALAQQVLEVVPLLKIYRDDSAFPAIYVSDRRVTVDGILYQPRILDNGWRITQQLYDGADEATFLLGNADDVFTTVANTLPLQRAKIEFSFYEVASGALLNFWAGFMSKPWTLKDGDTTFQIQASDGAYELNLAYPKRTISDTCWKKFADGVFCPATGGNEVTPCDKGYDTPAGCTFHNRINSFGGVKINPQGVRIKDNSTGGFFGGRSTINSVSLINDSGYGKVIPEHYCYGDMPVDAVVVAGRDESDFFAAVGVIGEGPVAYTGDSRLHLIDNQPAQDPAHGLGIRLSIGNDPNPDYFGIDQAPWNGEASVPNATRAAGTAWLELRRVDAKGIQLAAASDHAMQAVLQGGLGGWIWSAPGSRTWAPTLINPAWIAINGHLRAQNRWVDNTRSSAISASEMEKYFDVQATIAAGAICSDQVAALVGSGNEDQFRFEGSLREQKPWRDWLQEILNCCLGYYSNSFGKLRIGLKYNSSAVENFTVGNIIADTLTCQPIEPRFNEYFTDFGDKDFNWSVNSVHNYDINHQFWLGEGARRVIKTSRTSFVGVATKSQMIRVNATRLREELGGINATEWSRARNVGFSTTLIAANCEIGQIISVVHPKLPTGSFNGVDTAHYGEFRIQSITWNPDFSVDISGRTTTDSMYDLEIGPKPADVSPSSIPVEFYPVPDGLVWMPHYLQADASDHIYNRGEFLFGLTQDYKTLADDSQQAVIEVTGAMPVTDYADGALPPSLRGVTTTIDNTALPALNDYYFCLTVENAAGEQSPISNIVAFSAKDDGLSVTFSNIDYPDGTWTKYNLYGGWSPQTMCLQDSASGTPASITFAGPLLFSTIGPPSNQIKTLRVKGKRVTHSGPIGFHVTSVPAANKIQSDDLIDTGTTPDDWHLHYLSILGDHSDGSAPLWDFAVAGFDATTGTITLDRDCVISGDDANSVEVNDVGAVRYRRTSSTVTSITDTSAKNHQYPAGITDDSEAGNIIRFISGNLKGLTRLIDHTSGGDTWHWNEELPLAPTAQDVFIIEEAAWPYLAEATVKGNLLKDKMSDLSLTTDNFLDEVIGVQVTLVDQAGNESTETDSPFREIWMFGVRGSGFGAFQITDGN
jgi:hypothetical protein